jgi:pyruvate dehydrogenase E2 component (dihydrolipoamide acetyltransferase)
MPALSPTMSQGSIAAWHVSEGDAVSAGSVLADVETDKATLAFENQDDGFVAKLLVPSGARDVPVGAPVAVLVEEAEHVAAFADYAAPGGAAPEASAAGAGAAAAAPAAAAKAAAAPANFRLGPAARKALAEAGLTPGDIAAPSGPRGIIVKEDVLAAVAAGVKPGGSGGAKAAAAAAAPAAAAQQQPKAASSAAAAAVPAAAPQQRPQQQQQQQQQPQQPAGGRAAGGPRVTYTDVPNTQVGFGEGRRGAWQRSGTRKRSPASSALLRPRLA